MNELTREKILVKATEEIAAYESDRKTRLWEVDKGEVLEASLYNPSEEYFGINKKGQEVYVGSLNIDGKLVLESDFELIDTNEENGE